MNEETRSPKDQKENTIDILVPQTKKESQPSPVKTEKAEPPKEQTRKISPAAAKPTTRSIAQKTRVGTTAVNLGEKIKAKKPASGKPIPPLAVKDKKPKGEKKKVTADQLTRFKNDLRSTVLRALIYMGVVVLISTLLSILAIRWGNDIFALVKDEVTATVTIPEDATIGEVSRILEDNGLIEYSSVFRAYISFKNRDADPPLSFKAGEYELSSLLNYDQIVSKIKNRRSRSIVTITIPEGYTVDEIIDLFVSQDIGTREGFLYAVNEYPYEYTFMEKLAEIEFSSDRRYRLEGYLFPDTYDFYTDSTEVAIVDKMLSAFEARFEDAYYARLAEIDMNLDEVITLASIVQKEGKFNSDFYPISGVFHNRMKSKTLRRLQSDATVQYCLTEHKEELSYNDLEIQNPYNTYRNEGLPPSAISNPGWEAIQAALYPEKHSHYYFVSDTDGSTVFADTEPQHLKNVAALRAAKENGTTID